MNLGRIVETFVDIVGKCLELFKILVGLFVEIGWDLF